MAGSENANYLINGISSDILGIALNAGPVGVSFLLMYLAYKLLRSANDIQISSDNEGLSSAALERHRAALSSAKNYMMVSVVMVLLSFGQFIFSELYSPEINMVIEIDPDINHIKGRVNQLVKTGRIDFDESNQIKVNILNERINIKEHDRSERLVKLSKNTTVSIKLTGFIEYFMLNMTSMNNILKETSIKVGNNSSEAGFDVR